MGEENYSKKKNGLKNTQRCQFVGVFFVGFEGEKQRVFLPYILFSEDEPSQEENKRGIVYPQLFTTVNC